MNRRTKQLLRENNQLDGRLSPENNRVLTDIVVYIRSAPLSGYQQEVVRRDITQMLLDGEERGEFARDIIGEDYRAFCDQVIAELPKRSVWKSILSGIGNGSLYCAILVLVWGIPRTIQSYLVGSWELTVTAGDLIAAGLILLIANGVVWYICRHAFDDIRHPRKATVLFVTTAVAIAIAAVLMRAVVVCMIPIPYAAGLVLLLLAIYLILDRTIA